MFRTMKSHSRLILAFSLILAIGSCGKKGLIVQEKPVIVEKGLFETLWVEPRIIISDSLITLIRSDRIDSAVVKPSERGIERPSAVELRIYEPVCKVSVDLVDANLRLIRPLLLQDLKVGFYHLTLNADRFREPSLPPGRYFLRAEYCGRSEITMFTRP